MATYFVRKTGSDGAAGTSAGAAFLTIGKALGASGIASGDLVYVGAGVYREAVTVAMTSATAETKIIGDVDGSQTGDAGEVQWTAYATNDTTVPTAAATLDLNGRDFLTFQNILFVGGTGAGGGGQCVRASTTHSINITFTRCTFLSGSNTASSSTGTLIIFTGLADIASTWTFDRCIFGPTASGSGHVAPTLPTSASADYNVAWIIKNCTFHGGAGASNAGGIIVATTGAGAFKGGGMTILSCAFLMSTVRANSANLSTTYPMTVYGSYFYGPGYSAFIATTTGQVIEDYNLMHVATPRTNVTAGANSVATGAYANLFHVGHEQLIGMMPRPFLSPMASSPLLGFSDYGSTPSVDLLNRARPEGGGSATSAAADTGTATSGAASTLTDTGKSWTVNAYTGYMVKITGGTGSGQIRLIQSNTATVLTVVAAWATNPDNTSTYSIDHPGKYYGVGAYERHDTWTRETTTVRTGSNAWSCVGPGSYDFQVAVDASSTTVSAYMRYNAAHGTGSKPQMMVVNGSECGVADATATMTSAADTWQQLSLNFTPTAAGVVTIRLVSRAAAGNGRAFCDDFDVS